MQKTHCETDFTIPWLTWIPTNREIWLFILLSCQPFCYEGRLTDSSNSGNNCTCRTPFEPIIESTQFSIPSTHFSGLRRTGMIGRVNTCKWLKSPRWRGSILIVLFLDEAKSDIAPCQDTFVLSVQENLQKGHVGSESVGCIFCFNFEELAVLISDQNHRITKTIGAQGCHISAFCRQLPGFLSAIIVLNGSRMFTDPSFANEIAHGSTDVGRMLRTCFCNTWSCHCCCNDEAVSEMVVVQKVQEDTV